MSDPFAIWNAAEHADRVKAAASFYGVRLHVDKPDSPHLRLREVSGELYVGAAEHDDYVPLDMLYRLPVLWAEWSAAGGLTTGSRSTIDRRTTSWLTGVTGLRCSTSSTGTWPHREPVIQGGHIG